jgi:hypothetical protein
MRSLLQIQASRANGAKSRGPVTEEGKRASAANAVHATGPVTPVGKATCSQNATRHGMLAQSIVLQSEAIPAFTGLLAELSAELQPVTFIERRLVENMAVADWRRQRLWCLEMAQYTHAIRIQERANDPIADQENIEIPSMHTALAFAGLSDRGNSLSNMNRYEIRYAREYLRTLQAFREHRALRLAAEQKRLATAKKTLKRKSKISKQTEPETRQIPKSQIQRSQIQRSRIQRSQIQKSQILKSQIQKSQKRNREKSAA